MPPPTFRCPPQRSVRPQVVTTFELPGCYDMWTVLAAPPNEAVRGGGDNGGPQYGAPPYGEPQCVSSADTPMYHPNVSPLWGTVMGNPNMGHLNWEP